MERTEAIKKIEIVITKNSGAFGISQELAEAIYDELFEDVSKPGLPHELPKWDWSNRDTFDYEYLIDALNATRQTQRGIIRYLKAQG